MNPYMLSIHFYKQKENKFRTLIKQYILVDTKPQGQFFTQLDDITKYYLNYIKLTTKKIDQDDLIIQKDHVCQITFQSLKSKTLFIIN